MNGSYRANGVSYDNHFFINWQLAGQDIAGNFSLINWQAYAHYNKSDAQLDGGYVNTNAGEQWRNNGRVKNYAGTHTTRDHHLASGTVRINHRDDGNAEFQIGGGISFYGMGRSEGTSQVWSLPRIPRQSNPTFSKRLYTLGERIVVNMNRKAGFTHRGTIQIPDGQEIASFRDQHDSWAWTPDQAKIDEIYRRMSNTTRTSLGVDITTWNGGTQIGGTGWENVEIQIPVEENRPDFINFGVSDTNSKATELTGSRQILIKGVSKLRTWISPADKMRTKNHATAVSYTFSFGGEIVARDFSPDQTVVFDWERPVGEFGNLILSGTARDSRGLTTTASQTIAVLDYAKPTINAVAKRQNNFDQTTELDLSGNYTNFEGRNTILLVQYRVREVNGAWGAWKKPSFTASNGSWSVAKQFENFNRTSSYEIEVEARDRLEIVRTFITVGQGVPIAFISSNKKSVGIGKVPSLGGEGDLDVAGDVYSRGSKLAGTHIGQIIVSTTLKTPEAMRDFYGGTWVLWGQGRTIIGVGSNGENNYSTAEMTGGADRVTLTWGQMPRHGHSLQAQYGIIVGQHGGSYKGGGGGAHENYNAKNTTEAGNNEPHENRSKFITAYFWKKTAN